MPKGANTRLAIIKEFLVCLSVSLVLTVSSLNLYAYLHREPKVLGVQTDPLVEKVYWEQITNLSPSYRDAWLELAKIDLEMGNVDLAISALNKAKIIDPNSLRILKMEKEILGE